MTMAAPLFTLTLFRHGRIIHGATYFEDAGQRLRCRHYRAKYDTIAARSSHGARPKTHHTAPRTVSLSIRRGTVPCIWTNGTEKL